MTRQGKFKRAVRRHARETGQRYTEARAALDKGRSAVPPPLRPLPFDHAALKRHLEQRYGIGITSMAGIAFPSWRLRPSTIRVERKDGPPWVARVFASPADRVSQVEGDAEILKFLASHDFPAERLAHDEPVSVLDGAGVIVTEYVEGHPTNDGRLESEAVVYELSSLLGRLHTLPAAGGAVARDGGAWDDGRGTHMGRPKQDLAAAMSALVSVEDKVAAEGRETFEFLRDLVERADDAEGLPEALTHGNYHAWAAVGRPGDIVIVGWAGAGRGPRLPALAWHLWTTAEGGIGPTLDGAVRAYREHVQLTGEEMDRLAGVVAIKWLNIMCVDYRDAVLAGRARALTDGLRGFPDRCERIAARVVATFRS